MRIVFVFLFSFVGINNFAQKITLKPVIGINIIRPAHANNSRDFIGKEETRPGFDIGLNAETPIRKNVFLESGLIFSLNRTFLSRQYFFPYANLSIYSSEEYCTLRNLKLPILLLIKKGSSQPFFLGTGTVIKYNISSTRNGYVINEDAAYYSRFHITTKSGNRFGYGLALSVGKQFGRKRIKEMKMHYEADLSRWQYPTDPKIEMSEYSYFKHHSFSLLFSRLF